MQVPAQVEYEKATSVAHALALLARYAPGRQDPGRRAQPDPDDEAAARAAGGAHRHQRHQRRCATSSGPAANCASARSPATRTCSRRSWPGEHFAILHDAERVIADPIVRQWGTIGGSLCQADPSEDLSAAFAALKGSMVIHGPDGSREVSARAFHTGPYETVVGPAEMLTEIRLPVRPGSGSAYLKVMPPGGRLADRRGRRGGLAGGRPDRRRRHRADRGRRRALRRGRGRGVPARPARRRGGTCPGGRDRGGALQPRLRPARPGRVQAAPGRRAHRPGAAHRRARGRAGSGSAGAAS